MKLIVLLFSLIFYTSTFGQRSQFFTYYFKAFTSDSLNEITPSNKNYEVKSSFLKHFSAINYNDEFLRYGNWDNSINKWELVEADNIWRKFAVIQITKIDSKDTMTIINDTDDGSEWNHYRLSHTIDSIHFKKGLFRIVNTPIKDTPNYTKQIISITNDELRLFIFDKIGDWNEFERSLKFLYNRVD